MPTEYKCPECDTNMTTAVLAAMREESSGFQVRLATAHDLGVIKVTLTCPKGHTYTYASS
jgi:hypothetical protein